MSVTGSRGRTKRRGEVVPVVLRRKKEEGEIDLETEIKPPLLPSAILPPPPSPPLASAPAPTLASVYHHQKQRRHRHHLLLHCRRLHPRATGSNSSNSSDGRAAVAAFPTSEEKHFHKSASRYITTEMLRTNWSQSPFFETGREARLGYDIPLGLSVDRYWFVHPMDQPSRPDIAVRGKERGTSTSRLNEARILTSPKEKSLGVLEAARNANPPASLTSCVSISPQPSPSPWWHKKAVFIVPPHIPA
ncbi:hypothetical protein V1478_000631, partial [Vespula squamosa]